MLIAFLAAHEQSVHLFRAKNPGLFAHIRAGHGLKIPVEFQQTIQFKPVGVDEPVVHTGVDYIEGAGSVHLSLYHKKICHKIVQGKLVFLAHPKCQICISVFRKKIGAKAILFYLGKLSVFIQQINCF